MKKNLGFSSLFLMLFVLFMLMVVNTAFAEEQYSDNLIPAMTSYTTPSGVVSASSEYSDQFGNCLAWEAFDHLNADHYKGEWIPSDLNLPAWLSYEFPNAQIIKKYTLSAASYSYQLVAPQRAPKAWTFQGSMDNLTWVTLDTQNNQVNWSNGEKREFVIGNDTPYKAYRINITGNNGDSYLAVGELEMMTSVLNAPSVPIDLKAIPGNSQVLLSWDKVSAATGYTIKRSLTPNGPYSTIATNVTDTTYTDTNVTNGTTYYYVVTAVNVSGESSPSNEVSATPQGPVVQPETGRAILTITMDTGLEKEFDLSMAEVNSFISWYEGKAAGSGTASYAIDKHDNNKGPFKNRKDYVIFDKILTFEVNEYEVTE